MIDIMYYVHGSTLDNEKRVASGWNQNSLSKKGIKQAKKTAHLVKDLPFDTVFTSDLKRAIESAEIMFPNRLNEIQIDSRLRECNYGLLTAHSNAELEFERYIEIPFPEGESLKAVEQRLREFLHDTDSGTSCKIAIVGHRVPQLALEVICNGTSWADAIKNDWRICNKWQMGWRYQFI